MCKKVMPATLLCDFYKVSHREQYPEGTEVIYSTWIPRSNKHFPITDKVVAFGFQGFIKEYLIDYFNTHFFGRSEEEVVEEYERYIKCALGVPEPHSKHIAELHQLGHLPIEVKAVPEGTMVPIRVPMLTIHNTDDRFFWLTNYLETLASCEMWQPSTSATIAHEYKKMLDEYADRTGGSLDFVPFQGHDFSMRGMGGVASAAKSGAGHLLSFAGTDTIPAIGYLERYYGANIENELVGTSIPATEHSVMCAGGKEDELETYRRLIEDVYPAGFVSIVSDTWDLWNTVTSMLPQLRDRIMARDGKVVIRPDSGDPADILCGCAVYGDKETFEKLKTENDCMAPESKGLVELLWDIFGGTVNEKGYKELDPHIGCIYGDAITLERCREICERLESKGFASTNVVYGIGSYTYQYNTRDTFGFALKSTLCKIGGEERFIFKDPATDDGTKKSLTGAVDVFDTGSTIAYKDKLHLSEVGTVKGSIMRTIFKDGIMVQEDTLENIRGRLLEK